MQKNKPLRAVLLRVLSGQFKGVKLFSPASSGTHPMGSREKLALFNMINPADAKVLDLYAGSGALGIEAISRGARAVVFVENDPKASATIKSNLQEIERHTSTPIGFATKNIREMVGNFLETALQNRDFIGYFDIILADPPYDKFETESLVNLKNFLHSQGIVVLSSPAKLEIPILPGLEVVKSHTYAAARLTIYRQSPVNVL